MPSSLRLSFVVSAAVVCLALAMIAVARAAEPFVAFESGQVRPLALSPDGTQLFAVNTPDNTLEVFAVGAGTLTHLVSVPVGLEPIAVAARTDTEVWVVNHLSDSVSVVDLAASNPRVARTLLVGDEPRDIVFGGPGGTRAFVATAHRGQNTPLQPTIDTVLQTPGIGRADVWVFDAADLGTTLGGTPLTILTLFGDTPRALAVSPDGTTVYAAVFHSGNRTTTIAEGAVPNGGAAAGGLPDPVTNFQGLPQPEVGLIVQFDGTTWRDELDRDWSSSIRFTLPDRDVFAIDAAATMPAPINGPGGAFSGVGTVIFNMITNPVTGAVYVSNLDARNRVRFEGAGAHAASFKPAGEPASVRGHLAESRITVLAGTTVTPRHLNKHIDYGACCAPLPNAENATSLAFPLGMAIASDGGTLYVAGFGSSEIGVYDTAALANDTFVPSTASQLPVTGGGPTGLVLDEARSQLYVLTRFDDAVSVVSTATGMETAHVALHNPEPAHVVAGRRFLYDAAASSSHGDSACASCHIFGDLDGLAWDLGDPDGVAETNNGPFLLSFGNTDFAPMKGPMSTQSLRGMANHGPMHWRGDRRAPQAGTQPDDGAFDERTAFAAFNQAFVALLGRGAPLAATEMSAFTDFILELTYPPNPIRNLDATRTPSQLAGRAFFFGATSDTVANCNGCHVLDRNGNAGSSAKPGFFGSDGRFSFENETQHFKIPHLRNAYQKVGMFGLPPIPFVNPGDNDPMGDQIRGFGFLHDGSIDTVFRFHDAIGFNQSDTNPGGFLPGDLGDPLRRQVESFVHAFDTNLAAIVGQQITRTASSGATVDARIDLLIARATEDDCDLVVKGTLDGEARGALYLPGNQLFQLDRATQLLTDELLREQTESGQELTYTCVPPGSGRRIGIDRDGDGSFDRDEIVGGSDPADPSSLPASACGADPTCLKCRRTITKAAAKHVQTISKAYVACEVGKLRGKISALIDCVNAPDAKTQTKLARAAAKLDVMIASACGGTDDICGGDPTGEPTMADIGFPSACPNFGGLPAGSCTATIADCGGVTACVQCIDDAAVHQAIDLSYGSLLPANPSTQPELNRCQQAIGRETQKFLGIISKTLAQCWDGRNRGKHDDSCPDAAAAPGTPARKAADVIARAAARRVDWICRNCGGDDDHCDGNDDLLPAVIGSVATCPAVTVPGGASCARPITTLQDLVDCTACVTEYETRCMDRAAIPAFAPYPSECN